MTLVAERIVAAVLEDLRDRKGIGDELFEIEHEYPDVYAGMKKSLTKKVDAHLSAVGYPQHRKL